MFSLTDRCFPHFTPHSLPYVTPHSPYVSPASCLTPIRCRILSRLSFERSKTGEFYSRVAKGSPASPKRNKGRHEANGSPNGELSLNGGESGGSESLLVHVTQAWRKVLVVGEGGGEGIETETAGGTPELSMGALLEGFTIQLRLTETFGSLMNPIIKNEEVNLQKVNSAWVSLGRPPTLRGLLEGEKARGIHGRNGVLKDPSGQSLENTKPHAARTPHSHVCPHVTLPVCPYVTLPSLCPYMTGCVCFFSHAGAMALLWMRRMLQFTVAFFEAICHAPAPSGGNGALTPLARTAYAATLEQFHGWLLKIGFKVGLKGLPKRDEFFRKLAPGAADHERHVRCVEELRECSAVQRKVVDAMLSLFRELDLEDTRKVGVSSK